MRTLNLIKSLILITVFTVIGLFFYERVGENYQFLIAFITGMLYQLLDSKTEVVR